MVKQTAKAKKDPLVLCEIPEATFRSHFLADGHPKHKPNASNQEHCAPKKLHGLSLISTQVSRHTSTATWTVEKPHGWGSSQSPNQSYRKPWKKFQAIEPSVCWSVHAVPGDCVGVHNPFTLMNLDKVSRTERGNSGVMILPTQTMHSSIRGKSLKMIIDLHCFIPPKWVIQWFQFFTSNTPSFTFRNEINTKKPSRYRELLYFEWSPPWHVGWRLSGEGYH